MEKPKCKLIGENGNIFNLIGIASRTLKENGMEKEAKEMCNRITSSKSYDEALIIISEYVEITGEEFDEDEMEELINKRIEKLEEQIKYKEEKLKVCGYGKEELYELEELKEELESLNYALETGDFDEIDIDKLKEL